MKRIRRVRSAIAGYLNGESSTEERFMNIGIGIGGLILIIILVILLT